MSGLSAHLLPGERCVAQDGCGVKVVLRIAADDNEPHGLVMWVADATGRSLDLLHLRPGDARALAAALLEGVGAGE